MRDIRLCIRDNIELGLKVAEKYNLGIEVQEFKNPRFEFEKSPYRYKYMKIKKRSLHAPFGDLAFGSVDPLLREVALKRITDAYRDAEKHEFREVIIHHGFVPFTSPEEKWIKRSTEFWKNNMNRFEGTPKICIENMLDNSFEVIRDLIDSIDDDRIKICLDLGHANCFSNIDVMEWIKGLNDRIAYIHMHNNYGNRDEHNGLKNGNIRYEDVLECIEKYCPNAVLAIETRGVDLESSFLFLNNLLNHGFDNENC